MAGETVITIVGNLTADPELRYGASGTAIVVFNIAATTKIWDKQQNKMVDKDTLFLRTKAFKDFAENIAGTLRKGDRVIATGRLTQNTWENKEGQRVTTIELNLDELGPSLRFAEASIHKNVRKGRSDNSGNVMNDNVDNEQPPF